MTGKQLMLNAFNFQETPVRPCTPHWWGVYKHQMAGIISGQADQGEMWRLCGEELARVEINFYETFKPDMFHLGVGAGKFSPWSEEKYKAFLELKQRLKELESKSVIDEYIDMTTVTAEQYIDSGCLDHVRVINEKYGDDALILVNEGNPVCGVFENGGPVGDFFDALIAVEESPENLAYLIYRLYEQRLELIKALKQMGAHGYIGSETCVSSDIISPKAYKNIVHPALKNFYCTATKMGLETVVYFLGEINPIIDEVATLGAKALMIEEQKKNFHLDAVEIYKKLNGRCALFGNVDSVYHLLKGTASDVYKETKRQCDGVGACGFIAANGSPIAFDTPQKNIQAMLDAARAGC